MTRDAPRKAKYPDVAPSVIKLCVVGDRQAFRTVYDAYRHRVYALALRMLGNEDDAADALQTTFVKIFRGIGSFAGRSSFSTWVYRLTTNVCRDIGRKRQSDSRIETRDPDDFVLRNAPGNSGSHDLRMILQREIALLPRRCREVFVLHAVEGRTHREVGEILEIAEGTVKSHYHQARSLLRVSLGPYIEVLYNDL